MPFFPKIVTINLQKASIFNKTFPLYGYWQLRHHKQIEKTKDQLTCNLFHQEIRKSMPQNHVVLGHVTMMPSR